MKGDINMTCPTTVNDNVCVQAEVTITPEVTVGDIVTTCLGNPFIGSCPGTPARSCSFFVSQRICVQIPLTFDATAVAASRGIVCDEAGTGACSAAGCTLSAGFFAANPIITNALITNAGGSIILGSDALGLSFTVNAGNANTVLTGNTPLPPTVVNPVFIAQYQQLYRQLLAAKLNVLNGVTCPFATAAIAAADNFLATSPATGQAGAPGFQAPLEQFNTGEAPGCPFECSID